MTDPILPAPDWLDDLVIYELAPRAFSSPAGPGSGGFAGMTARLPYLADLGITGIWLNGFAWADPRHFYNIWTSYACIDPGKLDPALGSPAEFAALVDTAHQLGIRVLLDVVTHGVMADSPLVAAHPHWFKGSTWGMADFDWQGGHPDLDAWWVDVWSGMVERYGVDGFRLDVATYRPDLWQAIRRRAAAARHPIVVMAESGPGCTGVIDLLQRGGFKLTAHLKGFDPAAPFANDVARAVAHSLAQTPHYTVQIQTGEGGALKPYPVQSQASAVTPAPGWVRHADVLTLDPLPAGEAIAAVVVEDGSGPPWHHPPAVDQDYVVWIEAERPALRLRVPRRLPPGTRLSVQLSCHDDGWEGFSAEENPYVAQGSRFRFGYGCLLTPAVPIFMSGEEFDAAYRPLPDLSPHLYGGAEPGKGRWLYGSWLDWTQLEDPARAALWQDVQQLLAIRKRCRDLIFPAQIDGPAPAIFPVAATGSLPLPVPYLYAAADRALLVLGNPDRGQSAQVRVDLMQTLPGWDPAQPVRVVNLWAGSPVWETSSADLARHVFTVPPDGIPRGGLAVIELHRLPG